MNISLIRLNCPILVIYNYMKAQFGIVEIQQSTSNQHNSIKFRTMLIKYTILTLIAIEGIFVNQWCKGSLLHYVKLVNAIYNVFDYRVILWDKCRKIICL